MRISRVQTNSFRQFHRLDVVVNAHAVIVGENKIGKSNLLYALRLILDPSLPAACAGSVDRRFPDDLERAFETSCASRRIAGIA
jgi:putative ATP-dependent endonuclease of the OLD family